MSEPGMVLNNPAEDSTREQRLIPTFSAVSANCFTSLSAPTNGEAAHAAAFAILRNEHDAEDAAQEAMLKAFANIQKFRAEARFSTWLIQITVNEALMRRRRERTVVMEGNRRSPPGPGRLR